MLFFSLAKICSFISICMGIIRCSFVSLIRDIRISMIGRSVGSKY